MSSPGLKITNFHYAHIVLPVSQPTEYPKWIHMSGYESVIAQDAREEARLLERPSKSGDVVVALQGAAAQAEAQSIVEPTKPILEDVTTERDLLLKVASENNIKIDKRWSTDKIRKAIEGVV